MYIHFNHQTWIFHLLILPLRFPFHFHFLHHFLHCVHRFHFFNFYFLIFHLEPRNKWSKSSHEEIKTSTGFSKSEIEELERLCHSELLELCLPRKRKVAGKGMEPQESNLLTPLNMLIATFTFSGRIPKVPREAEAGSGVLLLPIQNA